jgi:aerobic-type carbon monoxide dehydrogenase small subunit (CoxS/CutS family)
MAFGGSVQQRQLRVMLTGVETSATVPVHRLLRDWIRDDVGLTGTKGACDDGMCGSCTVLLEGRPVKSCLVLAVQAHDRALITIEGLADGDELHPVQAALAERFAIQCGYCTPGFALTLAGYLHDHPAPTADEVREALAGNICRCTGYVRIVDAALEAAQRLQSGAGRAVP